MIWRISRRRVGTGFSFSQQTPTLHRSLSFFFSFLDYCFARWFCSAGLECSHSTWRVNGEVANLKQWRDATQPKNTISMPPEKPSSPPSIPQSFPFLPSFLHFFISSATFYWGGIWWFQLFCQKKLVQFFFSANRTEADGRYEADEPSRFDATHLGGSLGDDMISLSLQPSSSDNQPP